MSALPADGRKGPAPAWPLPPDLAAQTRLARMFARREELDELLVDAGGEDAGELKERIGQLDGAIALAAAELQYSAAAETDMWAELWATPQAAAWERLRWLREVAQYVRWKVRAELGDLDAAKEARQLSDRLGLNPLAMLRLRWEIAAPADTATPAKPGRAPRRRVRAVDTAPPAD